jgi:outer membrane protein TolC
MNIRNIRSGAAVLLGAVLIATTALHAVAGETVIRLSPARVVELAATQSMAIKASECMLKAQEKAVAAAFASFLPVISANASATHMVTKPEFEGFGGSSGGGFDSIMYALDPQGRIFDLGDHGIAIMLDTMFSGLSGSMSLSPNNVYSFGFSVAQPFFTGGKIFNAWRLARLSKNVQEHTVKRTRDELGLAALKMYWGYVALLKSIESTRETRAWFEKLAADQRLMYENGLIIELDVLNSAIQIDNLKLAEKKLGDMAASVAASMLLFLGESSLQDIEPDTSMLSQEFRFTPFSGSTIDSIIANRDDVIAAQRQYDMLVCLKKIQIASYAPTIAGFASLGYSNQYSTRDESVFKNTSAVGAQLKWTIFDWGKARSEAYKTNYQAEALKLQNDYMREQIRFKIADLGRKAESEKLACEIAAKNIENARKALSIAQTRYNVQAITNSELLTVRKQLTSKMAAYTQARINAILAVEEYRVAPVSAAASSSTGASPATADPGSAAGESGGDGSSMSP